MDRPSGSTKYEEHVECERADCGEDRVRHRGGVSDTPSAVSCVPVAVCVLLLLTLDAFLPANVTAVTLPGVCCINTEAENRIRRHL